MFCHHLWSSKYCPHCQPPKRVPHQGSTHWRLAVRRVAAVSEVQVAEVAVVAVSVSVSRVRHPVEVHLQEQDDPDVVSLLEADFVSPPVSRRMSTSVPP